MTSSAAYHDYVMELLREVDGVTTRKMMGEYLLYLDGTLIGGIYDDALLLKPNPVLDELLPEAPHRLPYEGSKTLMFVVESENPAILTKLLESLRLKA